MDFGSLLEQAQANQSLAQRKLKKRKQIEEEKKLHEEHERVERQRLSNERQKELRAMVVKQRLAAKGKASSSTNSSDRDRIRSKQPVARPQPSSQPTTTLCVQEFKNNKRIAHKPIHGNTSRSVKDPKVPLRSKPPSTVAQATTDSSKCLPKAQKHQQRKLEQPAKHSKPLATGSSVQKAKPPPPAVKFDDLMKLAQRKSSDLQEKAFSMGKTSADGAVVQPQQSLQGTSGKLLSRGSSPVGKALLEKKGKERKAEPTLTKPTPGSVECKNSQTSASVSGTGDKDHSSIKTKSAGITVNRGQVRECFKMRPPSGAGRLNGTSLQSTKTATQASKKLNPGPMGRDSNPVRTNSFYGARHEKLSVPVGKAKFKTRHNPGVGMPTSSWAQEMSQFVKQRKARGEEEEEEEDEYEEESDEYDDMDDFLDDEEDSCDYSSVIRDIFRYDKRKFVNERDDDLAMESSFAQQQFEEMRSSRIGRQEDEEDVRKEKERMARKQRRKAAGSGQHLVQTKLKL